MPFGNPLGMGMAPPATHARQTTVRPARDQGGVGKRDLADLARFHLRRWSPPLQSRRSRVDHRSGGGGMGRSAFGHHYSTENGVFKQNCEFRRLRSVAMGFVEDSHAALSMNSTLTASKGKTIPPPSARFRIPAFTKAVTSPWTAFTSRPARWAASRMETGPMPQSA